MAEKQAINEETLVNQVLAVLANNQYAVVATTDGDKVRARTVDYVNVGLEIGFYSWSFTRKFADFRHNNNIAVTVKDVQIEGTAHINPERADDFNARFQAVMPELYTRFTTLPDIVFVVIKPTLVIKMNKDADSLVLDHLDLVEGTAFRKKLSDWPKLGQ